jgi:hypothetical protein
MRSTPIATLIGRSVLFDKYQVNALDSNGSLDRKKVLCWNSGNTRADSERGDDGIDDVICIILTFTKAR